MARKGKLYIFYLRNPVEWIGNWMFSSQVTRNLDPGSYTYMFHEVKKMCSWPNNFWKYLCIPSSYTLFVSIHKAVGTLHWKGLFDFFLLICLKAHFLWQTKRIVWLFFLIHLKAHFFMSNTHEYPLPLVIHRHHLYKPWSTERVKNEKRKKEQLPWLQKAKNKNLANSMGKNWILFWAFQFIVTTKLCDN